ncbi:MAG: hypothetical protein QM790_17375 [Nibricoccus sp.]
MNDAQQHPFTITLNWLARFAGFPRSRLAVDAERLVLLVAAAQLEEINERSRPSFMIQSRDGALESAQRQHAERRKRVHFKCDNSAKV